MTWLELRTWMQEHPECYDHATLNVQQDTYDSVVEECERRNEEHKRVTPLGPHGGIYYRGLELIITRHGL